MIRLEEMSESLYSTEAWKSKNKKLLRVQRPHPIHFDGRKVTVDTFSLEHRHIVPPMKGLIELSNILYCHKTWKCTFVELWPDQCTNTRQKYKITIHNQSIVMYGLKCKGLASWSRFSTREHTDTHPHRETSIPMLCHRGGIMKTISRPLYFIVFYDSTVITWQDDSSRRNLF